MELTIDILIEEAKAFSQMLSAQNHSSLIGVTDGKSMPEALLPMVIVYFLLRWF